MRTRKWKDDLKAVAWVIGLAIVLMIYGCGGALADNLLKDYDISWGTGDGPVGAEDPAVASGGWANLSPATDDIQATLDWIDTNWGSAGTSYWQRNSTTLSPATANDIVEITSNFGPVVKAISSGTTAVGLQGSVSGANSTAVHGNATGEVSFGVFGFHNHSTGIGVGVSGSTTSSSNSAYGGTFNRTHVGAQATFDEWNTATSPYGVAPPANDAREYYLDTDYWFALNSGGKVYGWCDRDGDTGIDVEKTADLDKLNFKTSGTERAVLDSTSFDCAVPVDADPNFKAAGTDGVPTSGTTTITVITDVDFGAQQVQYRELTFKGGIITAIGSESAWTPAPLSP